MDQRKTEKTDDSTHSGGKQSPMDSLLNRCQENKLKLEKKERENVR
jgi:hypothetical protein